MSDTDHKRNMKLKLKVLEAELRLRERNTNASLKGYKMIQVTLFDKPIALMQDLNGPPLFERPPVRTLYVQD